MPETDAVAAAVSPVAENFSFLPAAEEKQREQHQKYTKPKLQRSGREIGRYPDRAQAKSEIDRSRKNELF